MWISCVSIPHCPISFTRIHLATFNKHFMLFLKLITVSLITNSITYKSICQNYFFQKFYKKNYTSHRSTFFNLTALNESCPPVYTLILKCFPKKGEPCPVKRLLKRLLPNVHLDTFTWTHSNSNGILHAIP